MFNEICIPYSQNPFEFYFTQTTLQSGTPLSPLHLLLKIFRILLFIFIKTLNRKVLTPVKEHFFKKILWDS
jgi:hypothetical protein